MAQRRRAEENGIAAKPGMMRYRPAPVFAVRIACAGTETGRIARRIASGKREIVSPAGWPDGAALFFSSGRVGSRWTLWRFTPERGPAR